jgi:XTP/dITP diphosphohydrolase
LSTQLQYPILYVATGNAGKLREFRDAAGTHAITVETVPRFQELPPCIEDGATFEENARKKALHYARLAKGLVFADDSGICVDALGGAPGVLSARYAGPEASDAQNNGKLLEELRRIDAPVRTAHYVCVIALAHQEKVLGLFEGRADGEIARSPKGSGGFGYDPHFYFPPLGKTFAELTAVEKFAVSHRGEAFRKLLSFIDTFVEA